MTPPSARTLAAPFVLVPAVFAASQERAELIPYQKHVLSNGLEVVLHEDHSEPVVAVYLYYHVGSSREVPGKSGFAHLFEHMLFQGSEHVGDDQHFKLIQEAGGTLNGTTNQDRTNYFETLPSRELELALWLESDRMGFLLPSMTQEKLSNQIDVVKNERRQSYENRPYGLVQETLLANLYPAGHPYSWPTIGSMTDLTNASLEDVADFFRRYYGPNNATLAIGGDFDPARALELVERYFGPIPRGPAVESPVPQPAGLAATRRVVLEDRVQLPQLNLSWPTVAAGHPDEAALDLLADVLSANKSALLDRVMEIEEELVSQVSISHSAQERAGSMNLTLRPNPGVTLDTLEKRVEELLEQLERDGVDEETLARLKNRREGDLFRGLETVSSRTSRLAFDNTFFRDPGHIADDVEEHRAVTTSEVVAAARRYLIGRPRVVLSVVPQGKRELAASEKSLPLAAAPAVTPLDRTKTPASGPARAFKSPPIWRDQLENGVQVLGTPFDKVPLTRLSLAIPAGRLQDTPDKLGLASLTAQMLEEGTKRLSSIEFTQALDGLGAQFFVGANDEDIVLRASVLNAHLAEAAELLTEVVLEPRFAAEDFERLKKQRLLAIETRTDRIGEIAEDAYAALMFGADSPRAAPRLGTAETIGKLTVEDVRRFWKENARAQRSRLAFVGALQGDGALELFGKLAERWRDQGSAPLTAQVPPAPARKGVTVYLIDKPGAAQSEVRVGHMGVSSKDPDYYPLQTLNTVLGGSFTSRINMNLREDKGYTYGARSAFEGGLEPGPFTVSAGIHTDKTAPALSEVLKELQGIQTGLKPEETEFARRSLSESLARSLESAQARLSVLENVGKYGWPENYLEQRLTWLGKVKTEDLDALARRYVHPDSLAVLVVGDRSVVLPGLQELDLDLVELDSTGKPLTQ